MRRIRLGEFVRELYRSLDRDQLFDMAAQQAYWALLSIFPFTIFVLTLIGYIPMHGLDRQVLQLANEMMPRAVAQLFDQTVREVVGKQRGWLLVLSLAGAFWTASAWMSGNINALNRAYRSEGRPFWQSKLVALGVTLASAAFLIIGTVALLVGPEMVHDIMRFFGTARAFDRLWAHLRWPISVSALVIALDFLYWVLPNVGHRFRLLSPGSVVAVLVWVAISLLFNLYVSHFSSYARTYGTLGVVVVLMTWLYLFCFAVLLGGEIDGVLQRLHSSPASKNEQVDGSRADR